jgi:hypothetical protein
LIWFSKIHSFQDGGKTNNGRNTLTNPGEYEVYVSLSRKRDAVLIIHVLFSTPERNWTGVTTRAPEFLKCLRFPVTMGTPA